MNSVRHGCCKVWSAVISSESEKSQFETTNEDFGDAVHRNFAFAPFEMTFALSIHLAVALFSAGVALHVKSLYNDTTYAILPQGEFKNVSEQANCIRGLEQVSLRFHEHAREPRDFGLIKNVALVP